MFNGTLLPHWNKIEGVSADTSNTQLDQHKGAYNLHGALHHLHAFKTTTVRNAAHAAPYMQNGVFATTLEEIIDFYDLGGGAGLGLELENQTLPKDELNLKCRRKITNNQFFKSLE